LNRWKNIRTFEMAILTWSSAKAALFAAFSETF